MGSLTPSITILLLLATVTQAFWKPVPIGAHPYWRMPAINPYYHPQTMEGPGRPTLQMPEPQQAQSNRMEPDSALPKRSVSKKSSKMTKVSKSEPRQDDRSNEFDPPVQLMPKLNPKPSKKVGSERPDMRRKMEHPMDIGSAGPPNNFAIVNPHLNSYENRMQNSEDQGMRMPSLSTSSIVNPTEKPPTGTGKPYLFSAIVNPNSNRLDKSEDQKVMTPPISKPIKSIWRPTGKDHFFFKPHPISSIVNPHLNRMGDSVDDELEDSMDETMSEPSHPMGGQNMFNRKSVSRNTITKSENDGTETMLHEEEEEQVNHGNHGLEPPVSAFGGLSGSDEGMDKLMRDIDALKHEQATLDKASVESLEQDLATPNQPPNSISKDEVAQGKPKWPLASAELNFLQNYITPSTSPKPTTPTPTPTSTATASTTADTATTMAPAECGERLQHVCNLTLAKTGPCMAKRTANRAAMISDEILRTVRDLCCYMGVGKGWLEELEEKQGEIMMGHEKNLLTNTKGATESELIDEILGDLEHSNGLDDSCNCTEKGFVAKDQCFSVNNLSLVSMDTVKKVVDVGNSIIAMADQNQ